MAQQRDFVIDQGSEDQQTREWN